MRKAFVESILAAGGRREGSGAGGELQVTGVGLAEAGGGETKGLSLLTVAVTGVASGLNLAAVELNARLTEGGLMTAAGGTAGVVVVTKTGPGVDDVVIEGDFGWKDWSEVEKLVKVAGVAEKLLEVTGGVEKIVEVMGVDEGLVVAVGVEIDLIVMGVVGSAAGVQPESDWTEGGVEVEDLVVMVNTELGLVIREEVTVGFAIGEKDWIDVVMGTANGEGLDVVEVLTEGEDVHIEGRTGLNEGVAVNKGFSSVTSTLASVPNSLMVLLALPHSFSTSAMMSPPPEMESKVRREEMSASRELKLVSPGSRGSALVGTGGACSLVLLTSSVVFWGSVVSDGVVAELSCVMRLLVGSDGSVSGPGLSRERVCGWGVRVRSSFIISTLFVRQDMRSGLGWASSFSSLSFCRNLTLAKSPFIPRRWRVAG